MNEKERVMILVAILERIEPVLGSVLERSSNVKR